MAECRTNYFQEKFSLGSDVGYEGATHKDVSANSENAEEEHGE